VNRHTQEYYMRLADRHGALKVMAFLSAVGAGLNRENTNGFVRAYCGGESQGEVVQVLRQEQDLGERSLACALL